MVLSSARVHHYGPVYFFVVGVALTAFFAPFVVAPNGFRRLNAWVSKSRTVRAMARARFGTDGTDELASDSRIRVVSSVAVVIGTVFLVIGIVIIA